MTSPRAPGFLFGLGLGGFIDGIVLHQVLQWHHMLTGDTGGEPSDTVTVRAWRAGRLAPPWRFHVGLLPAGWGVFNLVEGLVDHQILGLHHVRDDIGAPLGWDLAFLTFWAVLVGAGIALMRRGPRRAART